MSSYFSLLLEANVSYALHKYISAEHALTNHYQNETEEEGRNLILRNTDERDLDRHVEQMSQDCATNGSIENQRWSIGLIIARAFCPWLKQWSLFTIYRRASPW